MAITGLPTAALLQEGLFNEQYWQDQPTVVQMVEIIQGNNGPAPISSKPSISRHSFPCVRGGNYYVQNMSNIHVKVNELIQPFFGPL